MKSKLLGLALLFSMSGAASADVNWQGEVMVTAIAGDCPSTTAVADNYLGLYKPKNLSGNSSNTYLTFFGRRNAYSLKFTATAANSAYTAVDLSSRGAHSDKTGTLASFATNPPGVTATTPTLVINAQINNWFGDSGCTATIRGAFVRRAD